MEYTLPNKFFSHFGGEQVVDKGVCLTADAFFVVLLMTQMQEEKK